MPCAWSNSFGRVAANKKAIAKRGWGLFYYVLIDNPEMQETQERVKNRGKSAYQLAQARGCEIIDVCDLNTAEGSSGDSFMMFVEEVAKKKADT
jgi:hypothetical protein